MIMTCFVSDANQFGKFYHLAVSGADDKRTRELFTSLIKRIPPCFFILTCSLFECTLVYGKQKFDFENFKIHASLLIAIIFRTCETEKEKEECLETEK